MDLYSSVFPLLNTIGLRILRFGFVGVNPLVTVIRTSFVRKRTSLQITRLVIVSDKTFLLTDSLESSPTILYNSRPTRVEYLMAHRRFFRREGSTVRRTLIQCYVVKVKSKEIVRTGVCTYRSPNRVYHLQTLKTK